MRDSTSLSDQIDFLINEGICLRMQIYVGIWVLVSMMDFMPGKGEHETGIFCHFYGKSGATSWRYVHVDVLSHHTSIETSTKWWNRDYVVDIEVHVFFLIKAFGRNIEFRVKLL